MMNKRKHHWSRNIETPLAVVSLLLLFVIPRGMAGGGTKLIARGVVIAGDPPVEEGVVSASEVITKFHEALVKSMKAGEDAGYTDRYGIVEPVVRESYDFTTIARTVLGSSWKTLGEEDRAAFIYVFSKFTIATYASRFDEYHGEKFETISEKERRKNLRMVHSVFTDGKGRKRSFDYQMLLVKKQWRIVNVAVDGISDISLKRAEYTNIIKRKGFAALLTNLKDHIHAMEPADETNKNG